MDKETLILKWLNHELNEAELKAFRELDDYAELMQLQDGIEQFTPSSFDTEKELERLKTSIQEKKQPRKLWATISKIAAVLLIGVLTFNYFSKPITTVETIASEKTRIELPDASIINLNASSSLAYNENNWDEARNITLKGEAFFDVAKGATFRVDTDQGFVTVYGTEFNVKQRENLFEVICYEGLVGVTFDGTETKLHPGDRILILNDKVETTKATQNSPSWVNGVSSFKSIPYGEVLAEFERQYNIKTRLIAVDSNLLFSGNFIHNNIDLALKAITIPVNATYTKEADGIIIQREE